MICALYTLPKKYQDKKIYIWNINRNSIDLFIDVAFSKINIEGFVSVQQEYIGQMYMNRPVVSLERIVQDESNIILLADKVPESTLNILGGGCEGGILVRYNKD